MTKKFLRQETTLHSKIGRNRKKIQKWRRPNGRDSKMRLRRRNYPASPTVGHKTPRKESGKIRNLTPLTISNFADLNSATKHNILILSARLGARRKIEIIKKAEELKLQILNIKGGAK